MKISRFVLAGALFLGGVGSGVAVSAAQPHMQAALDQLNAARYQLSEAIPDKGGHRVAALKLVNAAIAQVRQGIEDGRGQ